MSRTRHIARRLATTALALPVLLAAPLATAQDISPRISPPRVLENPAAVYPAGHAEAATVGLEVTLSAKGEVTLVDVQKSAGTDFDAAAVAAVRKWKFAPATRDDLPIASRIRIPFIFEPPPAKAPAGAAPSPTSPAPTSPDGGPIPAVGGGIAPVAETPDGGALPQVIAVPEAPAEEAPLPPGAEEVNVRGEPKKADRGGSDFQIQVGQLAAIAGKSVEDLLQLAPGIFIANEGGSGHADQVFLRGFDAQTGSGIEFTVNGVPINEVDNTDGHGYADTHFIIPELVQNLRVIEGPFDPHQGDFAEAGSVDYELGVPDRRLQVSATYGSFNTERVLALWAPESEREGTFAAVQAERSDGYGQNRAGTDASAMAQYEGELGQRGLWRALVTAYATQYQSAGVVRGDDVANGIIGFYGTEDASQGGGAQRYTASFSLENPTGDGGLAALQIFLTYRTLVLDEDFTGFLLDGISPGQTPHGQRGDGILQNYEALTLGSRGSYKLTRHWFGQDQSIELGYYARYDHTTPSIDRVRFGTQIPYAVDEDMVTDVFNIAGFVDLDARIGRKLTLRGGVRQEYFNYNLENLCGAGGQYISGAQVSQGQLINEACANFDSAGPRLPNQQTTAAGLITEPKLTAIYQFVPAFLITGSFGLGATSQDATQISQGEQAPFTQITAAELGFKYHQRFEESDLSGRLIGYYTHTSADLYFNPDLGRLSPAGATERGGAVAEARLSGRWYDELISATYAYAVYDGTGSQSSTVEGNPGGGTLVPYIPNLIARSDTVFFHQLPWRIGDHPLIGNVGIGLNYVGQRALPLGQFAAPTFVLNASAKLRWSFLELGIQGENLLNSQYPLSEFFYASYFPHTAGPNYPTLAPTEAFTAAPPLTVLATLSLIFDKENDR